MSPVIDKSWTLDFLIHPVRVALISGPYLKLDIPDVGRADDQLIGLQLPQFVLFVLHLKVEVDEDSLKLHFALLAHECGRFPVDVDPVLGLPGFAPNHAHGLPVQRNLVHFAPGSGVEHVQDDARLHGHQKLLAVEKPLRA